MIKIICLGKIKETYFEQAIREYQKRLTKYTNLEIVELPDEKTDDKQLALRKEKDRLLKIINPKDYVITLEIIGKEYDSISFAQHLEKLQMEHANITFIIGSSHGLDPAITMLSQEKISFSKMTFPHQLFRILLLEQLYRSFKIMHNETYHK